MRVTIEIEGPIGSGKTRLAQFIDTKLSQEYRIEFVKFVRKQEPLTEIYQFDVFPL